MHVDELTRIYDELNSTTRTLLATEAKRLLVRQRQGLHDTGGTTILVLPGQMVGVEALKAVGFKEG